MRERFHHNMFTFRESKVVRMKDHLHRNDALADAGVPAG